MKRTAALVFAVLASAPLFAQNPQSSPPSNKPYTCRLPLNKEKLAVMEQKTTLPTCAPLLTQGLGQLESAPAISAELAKLREKKTKIETGKMACDHSDGFHLRVLGLQIGELETMLEMTEQRKIAVLEELYELRLKLNELQCPTANNAHAKELRARIAALETALAKLNGEFVNIDELDASMLSLDMFAPGDIITSDDQFILQAPSRNKLVKEIAQAALPLQTPDHVPGQLLVMLHDNEQIREVENSLSNMGFPVIADKNSSRSFKIWRLSFPSNVDLAAALEKAKQLPEVVLAQYNHYSQERVNIPNDAQFGVMWDMDNTGQSGGVPDADIDAPEAWDITTGGLTSTGDSIVVAVIDGGFSLSHNDLNFNKNYAETPNNNGIDDDGNGYIDDKDGWDAYNSDGTISSSSHGTHVSGTVGARGNNTIGVVGVNWGVKVMPIMGSSGTESEVVEAYTYVFDARKLYNQTNGAAGAFVVSTNSSFGVDQGQPSQYPIWCAMYDSLGSVGILSAAATANQNWDIDQVGDIPTGCGSAYMIAVTNTTRNDVKTTSAGYGLTTIDLGAPGSTIMSTYPSQSYNAISGTSMATPHVAGAIALMYAAACPQLINDYKANPDSIALVMRNYLLGNVDVLSSLNNLCATGGRLNVNNALLAVQTYNCNPLWSEEVREGTAEFALENIYPNPANDWVELAYNAPGAMQVNVRVHDVLGKEVMNVSKSANGGFNTQRLDLSALQGGVYSISIQAGNSFSNVKRVVVY